MTSPRNKLKVWLEANPSMTLRKFAAQVGCTNSYICQLAKDENPPWPSRQVALRIAIATGGAVTPNDLAGLADIGAFEPRRRLALVD